MIKTSAPSSRRNEHSEIRFSGVFNSAAGIFRRVSRNAERDHLKIRIKYCEDECSARLEIPNRATYSSYAGKDLKTRISSVKSKRDVVLRSLLNAGLSRNESSVKAPGGSKWRQLKLNVKATVQRIFCCILFSRLALR